DGLIEQLAVEKHQRHVAGLIKHPSRWRVGRQDRKVSGGTAAADPSPVDGALKVHLAAIVDAKSRRAEWRKGNIELPHLAPGCGHAAPTAWRVYERHLFRGKPMDELQYRLFRAPRFAHRHSHPPTCNGSSCNTQQRPRAATGQTLSEIFPRSRQR